MNPPIQAFPNEKGNGQFILDIDASAHTISWIILQIQKGEERVLAFGSKILSPAHVNYCMLKREMFSIVHFVQHYKHYLLGRKFTIRTDHKSLTFLHKFKEPE